MIRSVDPKRRLPSTLLQIRVGSSVALLGTKIESLEQLAEVADVTSTPGCADAVVVAIQSVAELRQFITVLKQAWQRDALTWIAYPKVHGPKGTDASRDQVRESLEGRGAKQVRQIGIDESWTAVRYRLIQNIRPAPSWP